MHFTTALAALALLALAGCTSAGQAARPAELRRPPIERRMEPEHLPTPAHIPEAARDLIWERMQGHGTDMTLLLWAVLFLDYGGTEELTRAVLAEPKLSRPIGPEDPTLNGLLPEEYFELQDELSSKAKALVEVTKTHDEGGLAISKAYGELTAVCVRCHAVYMQDPEKAPAEQ